MTTLPKIKFIQRTDEGLFESVFAVSRINHQYYSWQGVALPEDHELYFLKDLHLVNRVAQQPMHGFANMKYFIEEGDFDALAEHLNISEDDAMSIIVKHDVFKMQILKKLNPLRERSEELEEVSGEIANLEKEINQDLERIYEENLQNTKHMCNRAEGYLKDYDGKTLEIGDQSFDDNSFWIKVGERTYPVVDIYYGGYLPCLTGEKEFYIAQDSRSAVEAVEEIWRDKVENDKEEFAFLVGEDCLIDWALGRMAGPGSVKADSLEHWINAISEYPEEEFASYDGVELVATVSPALQEELEFADKEVLAYRSN